MSKLYIVHSQFARIFELACHCKLHSKSELAKELIARFTAFRLFGN